MNKDRKTFTLVLPIRAGSQRVINKNIRPFAGFNYGLTELKLRQLLLVPELDEILVDTDVKEIDAIINILRDEKLDTSRIRVEVRDPELAGSDAKTDDLVKYLAPTIETTDILWSHTTQPFLGPSKYSEAIALYQQKLNENFDSLMSVTAIQTFLWNENGAINYSREKEKWPRTQTIPKLFSVNSGIFMVSAKDMNSASDRIGQKPYLFEIDKITGWDIDDQADFDIGNHIAETTMKARLFA